MEVRDEKEAAVEWLCSLIDKVRSGDVVGVTVVTTEKNGGVDMQTVFNPRPGDVPN